MNGLCCEWNIELSSQPVRCPMRIQKPLGPQTESRQSTLLDQFVDMVRGAAHDLGELRNGKRNWVVFNYLDDVQQSTPVRFASMEWCS